MVDPPHNIAVLQPWILRKHLSLGWTPKCTWVGEKTFKRSLVRDPEKPENTSEDSVRRAVNYLMEKRLIGPLSTEGKRRKKETSSAPQAAGDKATGSTAKGSPVKKNGASPPTNAPSDPRSASTQAPSNGETPRAGQRSFAQIKAHYLGQQGISQDKQTLQSQASWNPAQLPSTGGTSPQPGAAEAMAASRPYQMASSATGSHQSAPWDTPNLRSQYSPDTAFSVDKTYFEKYDSSEGVPVNIQLPRQQMEDWSGPKLKGPANSLSKGFTNTNNIVVNTTNVDVNWELEEAPTLDDQLELLGLDDSDDDPSLGGKFGDKEIKDAVLFGASLLTGEDSERTKELIPQYGLLGSVLETKLQDTRIFLNSNNPASFFICGLQGSGKSHTLSTILENYLIPSPKLGVLRKPLSGLVLHFGEFNSRDAFRPCEAAFLASPNRNSADGRSVRGVTVLVSPSNYRNLKASYCEIPGVTVRQLKLRSRDLTIQSMLTLMSVDSSTNPPLYMSQVTKVLRDMAALGGEFDYINFTSRLADVDLIPGQRRMLDQRLELLESFLDLESFDGGCFENIHSGQQLMIVDLSCPFVDASAACVLFNICIGLFLAASRAEKLGKVIAVDEAHKYMTNTPASKILTEQLLSIIRQQRHYAARIIIATQEPTISPRLMDLASATVIHRFNSPEWFNTLRKHLSIANGGGEEAKDLFKKIISLRTGEALVFAPSALLTLSGDVPPKSDGDPGISEGMRQGKVRKSVGANGMMKMNSDFFKMKVRRRITADGGGTIRSL